jgi:hypothetical protein
MRPLSKSIILLLLLYFPLFAQENTKLSLEEKQTLTILVQQSIIEQQKVEAAKIQQELIKREYDIKVKEYIAGRKLEGEWEVSQDLTTLVQKVERK